MHTSTGILRERLAQIVDQHRGELRDISASQRKTVVSQVTAGQVLGGLRGVYGLLCDTSSVHPERGLYVRGIHIGDLTDRLPEEIFYLLLTGKLPDAEALESLKEEFRSRMGVPDYVWKVMEAMPPDSHPMAMLSAAILSMQRESNFRRSYDKGMTKDDQWEPMLEDALTLVSRLPEVAAGIYRLHAGRPGRNPLRQLDRAAPWRLSCRPPRTTFLAG